MSIVTKSDIRAFDLKTENTVNPLGIGTMLPLLSWKLTAVKRAQRQTGYRIIVDSDETQIEQLRGDCWDSGKVSSDETLQIRYEGSKLLSGTRYYWKVMVWDGEDAASAWSETAWFETGLLYPEDWKGEWIGGNSSYNPLEHSQWIRHSFGISEEAPPQTIYHRKAFRLPAHKAIRQAVFHGTCGSRFTLFVNGSTIAKLNTRWKQDWTSPFTYIDFTSKLVEGDNCFGCEADYVESIHTGFIGTFEFSYEDGSCETITTDETWVASANAGEGWKLAGYDDSAWLPAKVVAAFGDQPWGRMKRRGPAPLIRKEFEISTPIKQARVYIVGLGYFEASLNGVRLGDGLLQPDYTQFPKRVYAVTFDGTGVLNIGNNCIGIELGRGHYAYGKDWIGDNLSRPEPATGTVEPKFLLQLQIEYADGSSDTVVSDSSWMTADGPTRDDNIWYGDKYDARFEQAGWNKVGFHEQGWVRVNNMTPNEGMIEAAFVPPIRVVETIPCAYHSNPKPNVHIYDAGKVTAGWARLTITAPRGVSVKLIYGEKVREDGLIDIWKEGYDHQFWENAQEDIYVCKGEGVESWEPKFSYKGFRYIQVESAYKPSQLEAHVFHNDVETIGSFASSNPLFNQMHQVMLNTMLNNFHSIPTDTPFHEKRGWTGDGQLIAECASMNFDMAAFFGKWVQDIADSQNALGAVCHTCPGPFLYMDPTPAWMSSYIVIPWALYDYYGDRETLRKHYAGMKRYLSYELNRLQDGTSTDESYADWAVPGPFIGPEGGSLLATAYVSHSCSLMAQIAEVLGHEEDRSVYVEAEERLKAAINRKFYDPERHVYHTEIEAGYRQTSNILPIAFGVVPEADLPRVIENLVEDIVVRTDGHLDTGCFGTKYLAPVLTENGRGDIAYQVANQETYPGWGYCIAQGATTYWESWEEKTRSYNHFFLGTIDDWFYKHLAGIKTGTNGYKTSVIKPYPVGDLSRVDGKINTVRGLIASSWKKTEISFTHTVTVPVNTSATVYVPKAGSGGLKESGQAADGADGVISIGEVPDYWVVQVGSGTYHFELDM